MKHEGDRGMKDEGDRGMKDEGGNGMCRGGKQKQLNVLETWKRTGIDPRTSKTY